MFPLKYFIFLNLTNIPMFWDFIYWKTKKNLYYQIITESFQNNNINNIKDI